MLIIAEERISEREKLPQGPAISVNRDSDGSMLNAPARDDLESTLRVRESPAEEKQARYSTKRRTRRKRSQNVAVVVALNTGRRRSC
jgi:hypothetical protein